MGVGWGEVKNAVHACGDHAQNTACVFFVLIAFFASLYQCGTGMSAASARRRANTSFHGFCEDAQMAAHEGGKRAWEPAKTNTNTTLFGEFAFGNLRPEAFRSKSREPLRSVPTPYPLPGRRSTTHMEAEFFLAGMGTPQHSLSPPFPYPHYFSPRHPSLSNLALPFSLPPTPPQLPVFMPTPPLPPSLCSPPPPRTVLPSSNPPYPSAPTPAPALVAGWACRLPPLTPHYPFLPPRYPCRGSLALAIKLVCLSRSRMCSASSARAKGCLQHCMPLKNVLDGNNGKACLSKAHSASVLSTAALPASACGGGAKSPSLSMAS